MRNLSQAFGSVNHQLFIANLHANDLDFTSLKVIHSYLKKNPQKVWINNSYGTVLELEHGGPQGSVVGPLFLKIRICDFFYIIDTWGATRYAGDKTAYTTSMIIVDVISLLEACSKILFKWFDYNYMKVNDSKSYLLLSSESDIDVYRKYKWRVFSKSEQCLGVTIYHKLSFDKRIPWICNKASQKLSTLAPIFSIYKTSSAKTNKGSISSQYSYCPFV